jgi:hypothetical protein
MITDEMVEDAAERIFKHWMFQPKDRLPVVWAPDGNSDKQAEARIYAIVALEAVAPAIRAAALEEAAGVVDFMAAETRKAIDKLRPITEGPRRVGKSAMLALQAQLEACENRSAAIRALQGPAASLREPVLTKPHCPNMEEGKHD